MRTRKAIRRHKKTKRRGGQPLRGYEYTNPTSSNLNLSLYSNKVGGSCEKEQERNCKKTCKKLCAYTESLSKDPYIKKLEAEENALNIAIEPLVKEVQDWQAAHKLNTNELATIKFNGGNPFEFFISPVNENCTKKCETACGKNQADICKNVYENTPSHKTELTEKIKALKFKKEVLIAFIARMKRSDTHPTYHYVRA